LQAPEFIRGKINFSLDFKPPDSSVGKIQNRSTERLRPELVEGSRRSPKSKIQNRNDNPAVPLRYSRGILISFHAIAGGGTAWFGTRFKADMESRIKSQRFTTQSVILVNSSTVAISASVSVGQSLPESNRVAFDRGANQLLLPPLRR